METKKLYRILIKKYNLEFILKSLLNVKELKPTLVQRDGDEFIGFNVDGREEKLYIKSLDELFLIDESGDKVSETYIDMRNYKTHTTILKRNENFIKLIKANRCYEPSDNAISYIEEDHQIYSFDKVQKIYSDSTIDLEFADIAEVYSLCRDIDEDAFVEEVEPDRHDTLMIYDNKYMNLIDEDIYVKFNDEEYKLKYEDNLLDFMTSPNATRLKKELYGC